VPVTVARSPVPVPIPTIDPRVPVGRKSSVVVFSNNPVYCKFPPRFMAPVIGPSVAANTVADPAREQNTSRAEATFCCQDEQRSADKLVIKLIIVLHKHIT
jgi:hypothetical protein